MNSFGQNRTIGFGVLVIVIGFMILLHQFQMIPEQLEHIVYSWQMLLIVLGFYNLFFSQCRVFCYILISVGGFFILPEIFTLPYNFARNFWPIILIIVGLFIVFRSGFKKREPINMKIDETDSQFIEEFNVFSGSEKKISMKNFRGGKITSIFGGSEIDEAFGIIKSSDGNYVIVGDTRSNDKNVSHNNGASDLWIIKISPSGNLLWEKTFGGTSFDAGRSISNTSDNGFLISGSSRSMDGDLTTNQGQNDVWLLKIDSSGNLLWQKSLGGSNIDFAYDALELQDNSFIVIGESSSADKDIQENKGFTDLLIAKLK